MPEEFISETVYVSSNGKINFNKLTLNKIRYEIKRLYKKTVRHVN